MTTPLDAFVRASLAADTVPAVREVAARLAAATPGARAVLFYGSNLRTRSTDGVLDFYVLTAGAPERGLWPTVGYHEFAGVALRAKVATMRLVTFRAAAAARTADTTIWTRFVQPAALAWSADDTAVDAVVGALADAARSAARFAAALGPDRGTPGDYWRALFRRTYAAELRVERRGRENQIIDFDPDRYHRLLPLAWAADGIAFDRLGTMLVPALPLARRRRLRRAWGWRRRAGKPLNLVRLLRAAFTFEGAARYGAWKIERHTGVAVALTPWRERHPVLAAPGVLWRVWRARARAA